MPCFPLRRHSCHAPSPDLRFTPRLPGGHDPRVRSATRSPPGGAAPLRSEEAGGQLRASYPPSSSWHQNLLGAFSSSISLSFQTLLQKKRKRKRKKAHEPPGSQRPASVMTAPHRSRFICALPGDPSKRPDAWAPPQPGESESCGSQSSQTFGNRHDEPGTASGPHRVTQHSSPDITPGSQDPDL